VPRLTRVEIVTTGVARRPRAYVRVQGPDAEDFLQRMLSNDVSSSACEALLLTAKARVIAPLLVWRRGPDDFLLLTEPELGDVVVRQLRRFRFAARCEIEPEAHVSTIVFGGNGGIPNDDYGVPAVEQLDEEIEPTVSDEALELMRIRAGTPRFGRELDDRVLPAEAGLDERAISFAKGCYPGQEPVARLHFRGHANRRLRVLELETNDLPEYDAEIRQDGKVVGRVTSAARHGDHVLALGYVRTEVPDDAEFEIAGSAARLHYAPPSRP
jgi:folate-binding protein YgfZ